MALASERVQASSAAGKYSARANRSARAPRPPRRGHAPPFVAHRGEASCSAFDSRQPLPRARHLVIQNRAREPARCVGEKPHATSTFPCWRSLPGGTPPSTLPRRPPRHHGERRHGGAHHQLISSMRTRSRESCSRPPRRRCGVQPVGIRMAFAVIRVKAEEAQDAEIIRGARRRVSDEAHTMRANLQSADVIVHVPSAESDSAFMVKSRRSDRAPVAPNSRSHGARSLDVFAQVVPRTGGLDHHRDGAVLEAVGTA